MKDKEKLALFREFAYNCGDCGKGGCLEMGCMGWVFQQILNDKPFGICDWCGGPMEIPMSDVMREREQGEDRLCKECEELRREDEKDILSRIPMYDADPPGPRFDSAEADFAFDAAREKRTKYK